MSGPVWWQSGVIYQIYPRSFQDSDGDGVGDLGGIRRRLPYLAALGVDAIWLSPIFRSPMRDFGYDISDHLAVDPLFGGDTAFDELLADAHAMGLRVILDFVPNHTSSDHPWFRESRSSRDNPKRDWYIWRDPASDGGPPNNWQSQTGSGSAWTPDPTTGQLYYHAFLPEQPDLNWRNPAVRAAMADVLRYWLAKGVDGFRVDVIYHLMKDPELRDDPVNPAWREGDPRHLSVLPLMSRDHADIHAVVAGLREVLREFDGERLLIGEIHLPLERLIAYYGVDLAGAQLPFNFQLLSAPWDAARLRALIREYDRAIPPGGWPNWVLGNHDERRIASRVGPAQARVAMLLLLTLRGTPTLYYGDELGMEDVPTTPEQRRDPFDPCRDPQRSPMPWDDGAHAGFSGSEPWLPLGNRIAPVERQAGDPGSMLSLTRRLLALRREEAALAIGTWEGLDLAPGVLAYAREHQGRRIVVVLELEGRDRRLDLPDELRGREVLLSTRPDGGGPRGDVLILHADEGIVLG